MSSRGYTIVAMCLLVAGICYVILFGAFLGASRVTESIIDLHLTHHSEKLELLLGHIIAENYSLMRNIVNDAVKDHSPATMAKILDFYTQKHSSNRFIRYVAWNEGANSLILNAQTGQVVDIALPLNVYDSHDVKIYNYTDGDTSMIPMVAPAKLADETVGQLILFLDYKAILDELLSLDKQHDFQFMIFAGSDAKPILVSPDYNAVFICDVGGCSNTRNTYKTSFFSTEGYFKSMKMFDEYSIFINLFFDNYRANKILISNFTINVVILILFLIASLLVFWIFRCIIAVEISNMATTLDNIVINNNQDCKYTLSIFSPLHRSIKYIKSNMQSLRFDLDNIINKVKRDEIMKDATLRVSNDVLMNYSELKACHEELNFCHKTLQDKCELYRVENAKLERVNRQKSEFLANISHEIRTPLTAISGYAEILIKHRNLDDLKRFEYTNNINDSANYMLLLVKEILGHAKAEYGSIVLNEINADIRVIINQCITINKVKTDVEIVTEFAPDVTIIRMDAIRIKQVINNIISNAIKFSAPGHTVLIKTNINGPCIEITVTDTGIGIDGDSVNRIFEVFVQANTKNSDEGLGMGLPISRKIIELHGGILSITSSQNQGTTVTISLPIFRLRRFSDVS